MTTSRFVRCPDCRATVPNTDHDRDAHLEWHDTADAALAEIRQSLVFLGKEIDGIRTSLATKTPTVSEDLVGDWPEDDTTEDPTIAPDDDLEDPTSDVAPAPVPPVTIAPYDPNAALMNIHGA